jgi:Na+/melibiose symporter-like transporter
MYLTHNQKERDSATGYRMGLEVFGVFLAATIQGIMITIYGAKSPCPSIANDTISNQFTNEVINKNSNTLVI